MEHLPPFRRKRNDEPAGAAGQAIPTLPDPEMEAHFAQFDDPTVADLETIEAAWGEGFPVLMVEWYDREQPGANRWLPGRDTEEAILRLYRSLVGNAKAFNADPDALLHKVVVECPQPASFLAKVTEGVEACGDTLALVWIICHGTPNGLRQSQGKCGCANALRWLVQRRSPDVATYREFGHALECVPPGVTLLMGSCYAMADESRLCEALPENVAEVYGFTGQLSNVQAFHLFGAVLSAYLDAVVAGKLAIYDAIGTVDDDGLSEAIKAAMDAVATEIEKPLPDPSDKRVSGDDDDDTSGLHVCCRRVDGPLTKQPLLLRRPSFDGS